MVRFLPGSALKITALKQFSQNNTFGYEKILLPFLGFFDYNFCKNVSKFNRSNLL